MKIVSDACATLPERSQPRFPPVRPVPSSWDNIKDKRANRNLIVSRFQFLGHQVEQSSLSDWEN